MKPLAFLSLAFLPLAGCLHISSDPFYITMDVSVKVDKALDDFFDDIDAKSSTITAPDEAAGSEI